MDAKTIALIWIATCITIIEVVALFRGIDGQLFMTTLSSLVGLFGYYIGVKKTEKVIKTKVENNSGEQRCPSSTSRQRSSSQQRSSRS